MTASLTHTVPALAFHVYSEQGSLVFSGDTGPNDEFWRQVNGVPAWDIIYTGGSGKVKPGNATNTFTATCIGQTLAFYVNGSKAWEVVVSSSLPQLWEGYVGFGIAGAGGANLPTTFGVDQFIIE